MTITARHRSTCRNCRGLIEPGERINWQKGKGSTHVKCPANPVRPEQGEMDLTPRIEAREAAMLAAGRLHCTITGPDGRHVTLMFKCRLQGNGWTKAPFSEATHVFITAGRDGDKVATYYPQQRRFKATPEQYGGDTLRAMAAQAILMHLAGLRPLREGTKLEAANECGACGKALTDPESIARGLGPDCFGKATGSKHVAKGAKPKAKAKSEATPSEAQAQPIDVAPSEQAERDPGNDAEARNAAREVAGSEAPGNTAFQDVLAQVDQDINDGKPVTDICQAIRANENLDDELKQSAIRYARSAARLRPSARVKRGPSREEAGVGF